MTHEDPVPTAAVGHDLFPPDELMRRIGNRGGGEEVFRRVGERFLRFAIERCGLEPHEHVLDVGCGVGRMAIPLTGYLSPRGRYEGFDINPEAIRWCAENITPRYPNFGFRVADIANTHYNPTGGLEPDRFPFPYPDATFDYVFLVSVFTHMLPSTVEHYLSEIRRVLKPGGRVSATYFLLNERSLEAVRSDAPTPRFRHDRGDHMVTKPDVPEMVVGYREEYVTDLYARIGLEIDPPIEYGWWARPRPARGYQDAVVAYAPR